MRDIQQLVDVMHTMMARPVSPCKGEWIKKKAIEYVVKYKYNKVKHKNVCDKQDRNSKVRLLEAE